MYLASLLVLMMSATYDPTKLTVPIVHAEVKVWTQESLRQYAIDVAETYGLHRANFLATLGCENQFNATGQSQHPQAQKLPVDYVPQGDPTKEQSFGAAMINLPSHPTITKEMAEDPTFALPWMAEQWLEGRAWQWTCWKDLFK